MGGFQERVGGKNFWWIVGTEFQERGWLKENFWWNGVGRFSNKEGG